MPSTFSWHDNTLLRTLNTILTWSGIFAALIISPTSFTTQLYKLWASSDVNAFFSACDTSRTGPLVIALNRKVEDNSV